MHAADERETARCEAFDHRDEPRPLLDTVVRIACDEPQSEGMTRMVADGDVRQLIDQHVSSVWVLELLLLMKRDSARAWTESDLEREMRASGRLVLDSLRRLLRAGIVQGDGEVWRYDPVSPDLSDLCARLAAAYRDSPVAVINLIATPRGAATKNSAAGEHGQG